VTAAIVARGGPDETRRLLAVVSNLKVRTLRSLGYGCGLRASEVVRLKVKHIDGAQKVIRIEQSKGRNDCNVMLSPETLDLLRQWWKTRPSRYDAGAPVAERWLFPGNRHGKPMTTRQLSRLFYQAADAASASKPHGPAPKRDGRVNSAAWSFTKSAMLVGVSPVSLR
jgi:integrase/recombinase XerD